MGKKRDRKLTIVILEERSKVKPLTEFIKEGKNAKEKKKKETA